MNIRCAKRLINEDRIMSHMQMTVKMHKQALTDLSAAFNRPSIYIKVMIHHYKYYG